MLLVGCIQHNEIVRFGNPLPRKIGMFVEESKCGMHSLRHLCARCEVAANDDVEFVWYLGVSHANHFTPWTARMEAKASTLPIESSTGLCV